MTLFSGIEPEISRIEPGQQDIIEGDRPDAICDAPAREQTVTEVAGLNCHQCTRSVSPFLQGEGTAMARSWCGKVVLSKSQCFAYNPLALIYSASDVPKAEGFA
jgi:hypothetical protein